MSKDSERGGCAVALHRLQFKARVREKLASGPHARNEDNRERENDRNDHLMNGENMKRETYRTRGREKGKKKEKIEEEWKRPRCSR